MSITIKKNKYKKPANSAVQRKVNHHIGQQIKCLRSYHGKALADFGRILGVGGQQISYFENGVNNIRASQLFLIAFSTNTPLQWFFAGLQRRELQPDITVVTEPEENYEPRTVSALQLENLLTEDLLRTFRRIKSPVIRELFMELARQIAYEAGSRKKRGR